MGLLLYWLVGICPTVAAGEAPDRERAQDGMGRSLVGLQEGFRGTVVGLFGVGEHSAKFLFYSGRDGLRAVGRGAKKTDTALQKNLW